MRRVTAHLLAAFIALAATAGEIKPDYDIVIAGAGTGGFGAAVAAARLNASVLLLEETDWIGGQMNAAAVTSMDEGGTLVRQRGLYREFVAAVEAHYQASGKSCETAYWNRHICMEPRVGQRILHALLDQARGGGTLDVAPLSRVTQVFKDGDTVTGVAVASGGTTRKVACRILIDATEWGDVIPLTGARYRTGNCTDDAIDPTRRIQDLTWTAVIRTYPGGVPPELLIREAPPGYTEKVHAHFARTLVDGDRIDAKDKPWTFATFIGYRGMPDGTTTNRLRPITRTHMNYNNDHPTLIADLEFPTSRVATLRSAKLRTLHLLYYVQHTLGKTNWSVANDEGFDSPYNRAEVDAWLKERPELEPCRPLLNHFSVMAYARESRRIVGRHTLTAREIERNPGKPVPFADAVALGDYPIDLHGSMTAALMEPGLDSAADFPGEFGTRGIGPFAIPFACFIPEKIDGFLPAEKNISQSRLANGATRLQPSTMLMGQAAGVIAGLAVRHRVQPRHLDPVLVQQTLLDAGAILQLAPLRDVAREAPEWAAVQLTTTRGLFALEDGRFGPTNPLAARELPGLASALGIAAPAAGDDGSPVTRGAFARLLDGGGVKLAFTASGAERAAAITRSEAAQLVTEFLVKRALAKLTGRPQAIAWTSTRPATPPPAIDPTSGFEAALRTLVLRRIIDAPEYWREHAVKGGTCDGGRVADLILRTARQLDPSATAGTAVRVIAGRGLVSAPDYWQAAAVAGKTCTGQNVASLIQNIARHPE